MHTHREKAWRILTLVTHDNWNAWGNEVKPLVKSLRYRVKDGVSGKHLNAAARAVNLVWNHCNGAQRHALKHNTQWPTPGQLQRLTAGAGRLIAIVGRRPSTGMSRNCLGCQALAEGSSTLSA